MSTPAQVEDNGGELPESFMRVLSDYERHLSSERDLTRHTVRAYLADIAGLLDHAGRLGFTDVAELDLRTLRSWLARQQSMGLSRTTLARRATAARVFTAWLARTGRAGSDVGSALGSPRPHRTLPVVLRADEAVQLIEVATARAEEGPVGLRDVAILELLYATGIRVGELCNLDIDDIDRDRNVVRVFGKGRKERTVPFGLPAGAALDRWLSAGRTELACP
ncbi:MAG TPA: tyrosine-type recombinase/integrase, partial [Acidimicrobiales bacterium]